MASTNPQTGYAPVNRLNIYYEIHGTGEPLILLHGGVGTIEMFGEVLPLLADGRQVIAVDLQAHGRTADIDRPLSFELLGGGRAAAGWDGSGMSSARLAILPATTHYNIYFSPTLASTVAPFLDAPMAGAG